MDLPPPPTVPPQAPAEVIERLEQPTPLTHECVERVVTSYQVHRMVLYLVAGVEGGDVGVASANTNNTSDLGLMQINTIHLETLADHGITRAMLENNACINLGVAAWYLRKVTHGVEVDTPRDLFSAIARYHSHTDEPNRVYTDKLMDRYRQLIEEYASGS